MSPITLLLVFVICLWGVFYYRRREFRKYASTIPIHKGYPIIGHIEYLSLRNMRGFKLLLRKLAKQCTEGVLGFWVATELFVLITDVKYMPIIANARTKKGLINQIIFGADIKGIFNTDDLNKWRELKKPLYKQMSKKLIDTEYHDTFIKHTKRFTEFIKENKCGKKVNIIAHMKDLLLDIFSENHFGVISQELIEPKRPIAEHGYRSLKHNLEGGGWQMFLNHLNQGITKKLLNPELILIREILDEREIIVMEHKGATGRDKYYTDFWIRRMKDRNMSKETAVKELADVILAGLFSMPVSIANALAFLAAYPEIQEEVYLEQVAILGEDPDRIPSVEELSAMGLLDRVIKETLRLSCPTALFRDADENIKLDDKVTIPKGTRCVIYAEAINSDKRFYERPNEFYPDHFLPDKKAERPLFAFTVFGFGRRICPAMMYAQRLMAISLSFYIRNFRISTQLKHEDFKFVDIIMREIVNPELEFEVRYKR